MTCRQRRKRVVTLQHGSREQFSSPACLPASLPPTPAHPHARMCLHIRACTRTHACILTCHAHNAYCMLTPNSYHKIPLHNIFPRAGFEEVFDIAWALCVLPPLALRLSEAGPRGERNPMMRIGRSGPRNPWGASFAVSVGRSPGRRRRKAEWTQTKTIELGC